MSEPICVIVGATGAVGRAVVARLSAQGRPVLAVARGTQGLADLESTPGVRTCAADLSDDASVEAIGAALDEAGVPVRMALFTAGLPVHGSVDSIEPGALAECMNIKVGGTVRLLHAVRDRLADPATFISVAGALAFEPGPLDAAPGTVNAALANLMRQISQLYGPRGLAVHTIAPGPIDTPRLRAMAERRAQESGQSVDEFIGNVAERTQFRRVPTPDDIAWVVDTLLAPQAWTLHGSVITPDAGVRRTIY